MSGFSGFVQAALQLGLQSFLIRPKRGIYNAVSDDGTSIPDIIAQAVIEERHSDVLEITEHPVEQGAAIADHAFKRPAEVTLTLGWSNSPSNSGSLINAAIGAASAASPIARTIANIGGIIQAGASIQSAISGSNIDQVKSVYQNLLHLQSSRALFSLYTGKRNYTNMVCKMLSTDTDFKTENNLVITMVCHQVILVNTQTVMLPKSVQKTPSQTASTVDKGKQQPILSKGPNGYL